MKLWRSKKIRFIASIILALIFTLLGGFKLLVYFGLLISGIILGSRYQKFKQIYNDYKLGLRVNTLLYHSKQTEEMKAKIEQYEKEIASAADRIKLYQAHQISSPMKGGFPFDNIHSNGVAGVREDA
jgi:hypothetical protein